MNRFRLAVVVVLLSLSCQLAEASIRISGYYTCSIQQKFCFTGLYTPTEREQDVIAKTGQVCSDNGEGEHSTLIPFNLIYDKSTDKYTVATIIYHNCSATGELMRFPKRVTRFGIDTDMPNEPIDMGFKWNLALDSYKHLQTPVSATAIQQF